MYSRNHLHSIENTLEKIIIFLVYMLISFFWQKMWPTYKKYWWYMYYLKFIYYYMPLYLVVLNIYEQSYYFRRELKSIRMDWKTSLKSSIYKIASLTKHYSVTRFGKKSNQLFAAMRHLKTHLGWRTWNKIN